MKNRKILIVDDEVNLLRSLQRNLRRMYDITVAEGGVAGLTQILENGPFAVIVSDLQMPEIDGIQVLTMAKLVMPDTFRIMLTGNVTSSVTMYGAGLEPWFQYLNKPCTTERLCMMLNEGIDRPKLTTSGRNAVSNTEHEFEAQQDRRFRAYQAESLIRCQRLREMSRALSISMGFEDTWHYELAVMLSQMSRLVDAVPPTSATQHQSNDIALLRQAAESSSDIIRQIPRLECIAEMVRLQYADESASNVTGYVQRGGRILRMLADYEILTRTRPAGMAIRQMEPRSAFYGDDLFQHFSAMISRTLSTEPISGGTQATTVPASTFEVDDPNYVDLKRSSIAAPFE